jgi:hypothetical protein
MASSTPLVSATCGRETEMCGDDGFDGLALGIARESAGRDLGQGFANLWASRRACSR